MNKTSFCTRFNLFLIVTLFAGAAQTARAQGFFTPTDHATFGYESDIEILPDGYRIKTSYYPPTGPGYSFGDLRLNSAGEEISWDSIVRDGISGAQYTRLSDGDLLETGKNAGTPVLYARKTHWDGTVVWNQLISPVLFNIGVMQARQNSAGEIFLMTYEADTNPIGTRSIRLLKYHANGGLLWDVTHALPDSTTGLNLTVIPTQDGGCLYTTNTVIPDSTAHILTKMTASGQISWSDSLNYHAFQVRENSQGDIFLSGLRYGPSLQTNISVLEKRTSSGQIIWTKADPATARTISSHVPAENGDFLVSGTESNDGQTYRNFFERCDPAGNVLWKRHYAFLSDDTYMFFLGVAATPDNGFILAGIPNPDKPLFVLKINADGSLYPGHLSGRVALDDNVNCLIDPTEQALENWKVRLSSPSYTLYASTDGSGHYEMLDVPGDDYTLAAVGPSGLWESCAGNLAVTIPDTGTVAVVADFPVQVVADCPFMTVDVGTAALRRCFPNNYSVHYCNNGTVAAGDAYVRIALDPLLDFNSATVPYSQNGDTLIFSIGTVQSLECGDFTFNVTVNCDSAVLGQTLCVSAAIFPDSICNPPLNWSGGLLEGSGECIGDSVRFRLRNIGVGPTGFGLDFIVVDDHVIMYSLPLPGLQVNDVFEMTVPADGSTLRMIAEQEPNAPGLEMPSVAIENCGTTGQPSWGFVLQFPNRDGNPFTDRDCREVVGSYDPNDKQAFPTGVYDEHMIEQNTPLDYLIRFQNTGTDTAFTVVVKDTLSAWLDPATLRPGAASHPYSWALSGPGILTFTFENILLPDSNVNEAASHGFIRFGIDQKQNVPPGALLENRAGIYFDFNEPVMTNTVFHTVGHNFLLSAAPEPVDAWPSLAAWPNPAAQSAWVRTEKPFETGQRLVLRNTLGQIVRDVPVQGRTIELDRAGSQAGLYFMELCDERGVLGVGKIIWK